MTRRLLFLASFPAIVLIPAHAGANETRLAAVSQGTQSNLQGDAMPFGGPPTVGIPIVGTPIAGAPVVGTPWSESPLNQNTQTATPAVTRRDFAAALGQQVTALGFINDWRDTLRGTGRWPQRSFALGAGGQQVKLSIGRQTLPAFALGGWNSSQTGGEVRLGRIAFGTTRHPGSLQKALLAYDKLITDEEIEPTAADTYMSWLSARPIESKAGSVDLILARGMSAGAERSLWGARGDWQLPAQWKMRGEWLASRTPNADDPAIAWRMNLDGPVAHPWGIARASAQIGETENGFTPYSGNAPATGLNGKLALQQDVKVGEISGALKVSHNQTAYSTDAAPTEALPTDSSLNAMVRGQAQTESSANLRWKLTPALSVTAKGSVKNGWRQFELPASGSPAVTAESQPGSTPSGETAAEAQTVASSLLQSGDVGLELKVSPTVALTVSTGTTVDKAALHQQDAVQDLARRGENRIALGIKRKSRKSLLGVELTRHERDDLLPGATDKISQSLRIEAERDVLPLLRVRGVVSLSDDDTITPSTGVLLFDPQRSELARRNAEAQFTLKSLARLDLRYSDWNDSTQTASPRTPGEYGVKLNMGSAAEGSGLGLALEYARKYEPANDLKTWRIGVTFK
jgi:hypothetical protein